MNDHVKFYMGRKDVELNNELLTINEYSRPGRKLSGVKAVIIHWIAKPGQPAKEVRQYWEDRKDGKNGYGSAHYIIGQTGVVTQTIPDDEVAYHCGATSPVKPGSDQYYTDYARDRWPEFTLDYKHKSTNQITVGVEMCHPDWSGEPTRDTYVAAVELVATLCVAHGLNPKSDVLRHQDIVGYKECPRFYCRNLLAWQRLKADVVERMKTIGV